MNVTKYRFTLLFILSILIWVTTFVIYNWCSYRLAKKIQHIATGLFIVEPPITVNTLPIPPISVSIHDIISERYLYTLTRYIENNLSASSGTGIQLASSYQTFDNITMSGSNFTFTLDTISLDIPVSSYFFDIWNKKSKWVVSWEILSNTWTVEQWDKKVIALTFDDGPSPKYTNILLDILKKENIKVTFYVLWSRVDEYPNILKREYLEWHEIGNHSYSHALLTKLSERMMQEELYKTDQAIYRAINIYPRTFRPPYGWVSTGILQKADMPAILWSIDTHDWKTLNVVKDISSVTNAKDGDIIIIHDIHEASIESIPWIIKNLKERWFTFVTISELLSLSDSNTQIWKKCTKKGSCK